MKQTVKRVPVRLQMEAVECGAACLGMILAYHKRFVAPEVLREDCGVSRDGCSVKDLTRAARYHGLVPTAVRTSCEKIRQSTELPMILHWNYAHYVVLCGFRGNRAIINDPAQGRIAVPEDELEQSFTGIAIRFRPSEEFTPTEQERDISMWYSSLEGAMRTSLLSLVILGLLAAILQLTQPLFYRYFSDNILLRSSDTGLNGLLAVMGIVMLLTFVTRLLQSLCIAGMVRYRASTGSRVFVNRLLHLPEAFYAQRFSGDLISRLAAVKDGERFLFAALLPTLIDLVMSVLYLAVMLLYNVPLALIGVVFSVLNLILIRRKNRMGELSAAKLKRDAMRIDSLAMSVVYMIESLKACGAESGSFRRISGSQSALSRSKLEWREKAEYFDVLLRIFSELAGGAVLFFGILLIFNGHSTIGMLMAFQGMMNNMMLPAKALAGSSQGLQLAVNDRKRIRDVTEYPLRPAGAAQDGAAERLLRGEITLEHVDFGYSRLKEQIIRDFSLHIPAGSTVVLTGGSGCGKSTICQLIAGQYRPYAGAILFDGESVENIGHETVIRSLAAVNQRISLFSGTVRDNLTLWDRRVPDEALVRACRDAGIYETVMRMGGGFDSVLIENGRNLSGGQRQQLEIARALVKDPTVLLLDEATSALDPITEKQVMDNIRARGITCVIVAHRLSAIRDAEQIVVLEHGAIVEQGTHEQLVSAGGQYAQLLQ